MSLADHEEVLAQKKELEEFEKNPMLLQMPDQRWYIEQLVEDGETAVIRNKAKALLQAVPCATCVTE